MCDDFDVLIVDVYALGDVHVLNRADDVAQRGVRIGQTQQVVRVDRALGQLADQLRPRSRLPRQAAAEHAQTRQHPRMLPS